MIPDSVYNFTVVPTKCNVQLDMATGLVLTGTAPTVDPSQPGKNYYILTNSLMWSSAQQACMTCFEDLAVINSAELTQAIPSPSYATWIGLSRSSAGDFVWVVDNQTVYGNWAAGEPTNDNCVYLQTNKMWNSYPCSNGLWYMCQEDPYQGTLTASSITSYSVTLNWTQAPGPVTSYTLKVTGPTNQTQTLTLGNVTGTVLQYLIPASLYTFQVIPNKCQQSLNSVTGSAYTSPPPSPSPFEKRFYIPSGSLTWDAARSTCQSCFEDLAVINSPTRMLNVPNSGNSMWIGYRRASDNFFAWVDGNQTLYSNWVTGADSITSYDCAYLQTNMMWNSYVCYGSMGFLCQEDPYQGTLTASSITSYSVTLNWTQAPGPVTSYTLKVTGPTNQTQTLTLGNVTGTVLQYLIPASLYTFQVIPNKCQQSLNSVTGSAYTSPPPSPSPFEKQFYIPSGSLTWDAARSTCQSCFEDLAVINSAARTLNVPNSGISMWIGYRRASDNFFAWVDRNQTLYSNWVTGADSITSYDCAYLQTNIMWNSYVCYGSMGFLCQEDPYYGPVTFSNITTSSITVNWTQAPGPVNSYTVTVSGPMGWSRSISVGNVTGTVVNYLIPNSNYTFQIVPTKCSINLNPAVAYASTSQMFFPSQPEKRFYIMTSPLSWNDARQKCISCFQDLAVLNSAERMQAVPITGLNLWMGYYQVVNGIYLWVDGNETFYNNWAAGQPNIADNCAYLATTKLWYSYLCSYTMPYICQEDRYYGIITFSDINSSSVTLNWTQVPGPVDSYELTIIGPTTPTWTLTLSNLTGTVVNYLIPDSLYTFAIIPNKCGFQLDNATSSIYTCEFELHSFSSTISARVSWDPCLAGMPSMKKDRRRQHAQGIVSPDTLDGSPQDSHRESWEVELFGAPLFHSMGAAGGVVGTLEHRKYFWG
ncbi:uncharacterized protein LOC114649576 [Erpetoichthys calabaricus]|uniref:uncharacterized protein LOC114649576 n=1 Tax=Erpetoichthys calabaricus TaxID=27687 RepID=UPI002234E26B|nr:uncharacterized protein LOC114649576 [Erpetoichthys calabaricus]